MRINFKSFKKVREDVETATLKNDRGHEITLSKKALRPHLLKSLTELPLHLKDGTPEGVESPQLPDPASMPSPVLSPTPAAASLTPDQAAAVSAHVAPDPNMGLASEIGQLIGKYGVAPVIQGTKMTLDAYGKMGAGLVHGAQDLGSGIMKGAGYEAPPEQASAPAPGAGPVPALYHPDQSLPATAPDSLPSAAQQPSSNPLYSNDPLAQYQKGINQQVAGINAEAKAAGELGKQQADLYKQQIEASRQMQASYQQQFHDLNVERENIIQDIRANKINPNHYVENMGSAQRRNTWIGLLLSGAGSGLSHQNNLAADYLQKAIDRDISAQVKNLDSKNNLLSANLQQFGNLKDAMAMTRINMQDILANQIAEAASRSSFPMAKAKAQQAVGALMAGSAEKTHQLAVERMMYQSIAAAQGQQSGGQGESPTAAVERQLPVLRMYKPEMAKDIEGRLIPGVGVASVPVNDANRGKITAAQLFDQKMGELEDFAKQHQGSVNPAIVKQGKTLAADTQNAYRQAEAMGVFRESEQGFNEKLIPSDPTALFASARTLPAYRAMRQSNRQKYDGLLKSLGVKNAGLPSGDPNEGKTARNQAGQRIVMKNGKWVPL